MAGQQTKGPRRSSRSGVATSGRGTKTDQRERVRAGRARDRDTKRAYEAGLAGDEGALTDDRQRPHYDAGRADAKKAARAKRTAGAKRTATKKARSTGRAVARDAKRLAPAAAGQVSSAMALAGMSLALVGLYLLLNNVSTFQGVLGGLARGVSWLADPGKSIPYNKGAVSS